MEIFDRKRQLIPRWHTSTKFSSLHLPSPKLNVEKLTNQEVVEYRLDKAFDLWGEFKTKTLAIEIVSKLKLIGKESEIPNDVLNFLQKSKEDLSEEVKKIIFPYSSCESKSYVSSVIEIQQKISEIKKILRSYPKDGLLLNDLAFYYASIGEKEKAEKYMKIAFSVSDFHVFIARNYARFLVNSDPEKALYVLKKTEKIKSHSLVASADIAIKCVFGIGRLDIKSALKLLESKANNQVQKSELFSSLGTIEIENGSISKGKKLIANSLVNPTENSIAQAHWISRKAKVEIDKNLNELKSSLEGDVIEQYANKNYKECRDALIALQNFQPFTDRAIVDAGYLSLVALNDPEFTNNLYDQYSYITQYSVMAQNNKVVALLEMDKIYEANILIKKIQNFSMSSRENNVFIATKAMYLYRTGQFDEGRKLYDVVSKRFMDENNMNDYAKLLYHFGKEEVKVNKEAGLALVKKAKDIFGKQGSSFEYLLRIEDVLSKKNENLNIPSDIIMQPTISLSNSIGKGLRKL